MNIKDLHDTDKGVSAKPLFKTETGTTLTIQILKGETLAEHITKIPAMLLCVSGKAQFQNEQGQDTTIKQGDYIKIEPMVKHWVNGLEDSRFVLVK
jgi:quercetin dioxygenase-like cupin family protein